MPKHLRAQINLILAAAFILTLPALFSGLMGDDYLHFALLTGDLPIAKPDDLSLFGLFSFINGDPERNRQLMDYSLIPWWTYTELKYAFWRPLSELTHWVDHKLWPRQPWLMHLQNIFWYLAAVMLISKLYKQLLGDNRLIVAFAVLLYALDSTHGFTVSWISNRNALIALTFGVGAILSHITWCRDKNLTYLILGLMLQLFALLAAELGISAFGYILAYGCFLDKSGPIKGIFKTAPYFVLIVAWWVCYKQLGFGASHADAFYVDPVDQPLGFIAQAMAKLPVLLASQWGIIPADIYTLFPRWDRPLVMFSVAFLVAIFLPIYQLTRSHPSSLFLLAGMMFSIFPALAASPYDRLLLFPGIGAAALLAIFLNTIWPSLRIPREWNTKPYLITIAYLMVLIHLILSPLLLPAMSYSTKWLADAVSEGPSHFPEEDSIRSKKLVLFSTPMASSVALAALRYYRGDMLPERVWTITSLRGEVELAKKENTVIVRRKQGFIQGDAEESVRNLKQYPLTENDQIDLSGLSIHVQEIDPNGKPHQLVLTFTEELTEENYTFLQWDNGKGEYRSIFPNEEGG